MVRTAPLGHQLGHGLRVELAEGQAVGPGGVEGLQRHRADGEPPGQRAQGQEAGGVGPLQVVQAEHQRSPPGHHLETAGAGGLQRLGEQTGLADPRLALHDHDRRPSPRRPTEGLGERP